MFGQLGNMIKMGQLQAGKTVKFSKADLVNYSINLMEAKKRLSDDKYKEVYDLFIKLSKENKKIEMDLGMYKSIIKEITDNFVQIDPAALKDLLDKEI